MEKQIKRNSLFLKMSNYPIGVMIDEQVQVIVHGGGGHSILEVFGEETFVDHVVVQSIVQLDINIAHESSPHFL